MNSPSAKVRIGLVQMQMSESQEENRASAEKLIEEAATGGAEIVCLPELFSTPYFCSTSQDASRFAEHCPGPSTEMLSAAAKRHEVYLVGGSIYEDAKTKRYNTALVFGPDGEQLGKYRKIHIPQDEAFYEKDYFTPGDLGYLLCETPIARFGVLICYDQWFPEAARALALKGAEIIFYPTAIGNVSSIEQSEGPWQDAWENVQRGHAIANGLVTAAVNRVGTEGETSFWGGSFVCDAFGKTLARADDTQGVLIQEIDLEHGKEVKSGWGFLENRRSDTYGPLSE